MGGMESVGWIGVTSRGWNSPYSELEAVIQAGSVGTQLDSKSMLTMHYLSAMSLT